MGIPYVDCLIFSKDRPAQLDLLLRSIDRYASSLYDNLLVVYKATETTFRHGYDTLFRERLDLGWVPEYDFESHVRTFLMFSPGDVSFLCDDDVFYRHADRPESVPWSLRGGDYDYPFSVDGNVYLRHRLLQLLDGLTFGNPTELEARGDVRARELGWGELHHGRPCLVGLPLNRVSASSQMGHMGVHEYDLNERFLQGDRLRLLPDGDYGAHEMIFPGWESERVAA